MTDEMALSYIRRLIERVEEREVTLVANPEKHLFIAHTREALELASVALLEKVRRSRAGLVEKGDMCKA
jgi:hypothetical protein